MSATEAPELHTIRRMHSMPALLEFEASNIEADAGIIRDVVMVQEGEAKGHGFHIEAEFITDLVAYDQASFGRSGLKARLGHPGMSDDAMGTQMGYFRNYRTREKRGKMQAIADLHLLEAADASPVRPGMREWVIQMAGEAPDFIMSSIVFKPGRYYQKARGGDKRYVHEYDADGHYQYPDEGKKIFIEFGDNGEHYYTDLVEAGAATDRLFSNTANPRLFVARLGEWLDDNPDIREFITTNPDKVQAFLDRIGFTPTHTPQPFTKMSLKELLFGKDKPENDTALSAAEVQELRDKLAAADTELARLAEENTSLKSGIAETERQLGAAQLRITELEKAAAAAHTELTPDEDDEKTEKVWDNDPVNQRARRAYQMKPRKNTTA